MDKFFRNVWSLNKRLTIVFYKRFVFINIYKQSIRFCQFMYALCLYRYLYLFRPTCVYIYYHKAEDMMMISSYKTFLILYKHYYSATLSKIPH